MKIYLDNAATTKIDSRVAEAMMPYLTEHFGNPSSLHSFGRDSRSAIEKARKKISALLGTQPANLFFTSGGTEADNQAIISTIVAHKIPRAISSPLEHHAVLQTLEQLHKNGQVELKLLEVDKQGNFNQAQLRNWMEEVPQSFVSLMQANNEIGNIYPVEEIAAEVKDRGGFFHSDTVQTTGRLHHDLTQWKTDFMVGSAHKFHGPKGIGFLALRQDIKIPAYIYGGSQERNMRGGTENLMSIVGMAEAFEISITELDTNRKHIEGLKNRLKELIVAGIPGVGFNGRSAESDSMYTILNVSFPESESGEMLLFNLDINGVAASGGSACSSGSEIGSHVLRGIGANPARASVRFSFSKFNTMEEVEHTAALLCRLYSK
jgi:cysteine desulfurase